MAKRSLFLVVTLLLTLHTQLSAQAVEHRWVDTLDNIGGGYTMGAVGYAVLGNRLYIGGGVGDVACAPTLAQWSYSPGSGWQAETPLAAKSASTYWIGCAAGVGSGKIWYSGGWDACDSPAPEDTADSYDPGTSSWIDRMTTPAGAAGYAFTSVGEYIYLFGGQSGGGTSLVMENYTRVIDTNGPTATTCLAPPEARSFGAAVELDGLIYYIGGQIDNAPPDMGHVALSGPCAWPECSGMLAPGGMTSACGDPAWWTCYQGFYGFDINWNCCTRPICCSAHGGACDCNPEYSTSARMDIYDPGPDPLSAADDTWIQGPDMPQTRAGHRAVAKDGLIYVIGGFDSCRVGIYDLFVYSPICQEWTAVWTHPYADVPPFQGEGGRMQHAVGVLDDGGTERIYRAGGLNHWGECLSDLCYLDVRNPDNVPRIPTCAITGPAPGATVCGDVDIDFEVTDSDNATLAAAWKWSSDGGKSWNPCTEVTVPAWGAAVTPVPDCAVPCVPAPLVGTFTWDADADVGSGPTPVIVAMCVSDGGNEYAQDRVDLLVQCTSCCNLPGDCDLNGFVNILDVLAAARHDAGLAILNPVGEANCNVLGPISGGVTMLDALIIAQYVVAIVPGLDCCP